MTRVAITSQDLVDRTDVQHSNGTATSSVATVTLADESGWIRITNTSATTDMFISLDGGSNFETVYPQSTETYNPARNDEVQVKTSSGSATYELMYAIDPV